MHRAESLVTVVRRCGRQPDNRSGLARAPQRCECFARLSDLLGWLRSIFSVHVGLPPQSLSILRAMTNGAEAKQAGVLGHSPSRGMFRHVQICVQRTLGKGQG